MLSKLVNAMEKLNSILTGRKCSKWKWLDLHAFRFLDLPIPMPQVLRMDIPMFLHYGLYVYITFEIFGNITQNTTPEENSQNMFHISSPIVVFFLWEGEGQFWIRIKFHLERAKGRGKRGYGEENQNEGYFMQNFHY